jgi:hypothetical protein
MKVWNIDNMMVYEEDFEDDFNKCIKQRMIFVAKNPTGEMIGFSIKFKKGTNFHISFDYSRVYVVERRG